MQEWIIAMLVISVLLILRDMAKTILTGRMSKKEEIFPIGEDHPQKEKVERYAAAFQKLADTFYGMPYKKEYLSSGQIERILTDANDRLCSNCYHREICWGSQAETMCQGEKHWYVLSKKMMKENLRNFVCNGGAYAENHCNIWKKYANSFDRKNRILYG